MTVYTLSVAMTTTVYDILVRTRMRPRYSTKSARVSTEAVVENSKGALTQ